MGKVYQKIIDDFSGLMAQDPRDKDTRKFYHSKHFDAHTYKHKLVPRFEWSDENNGDGLDFEMQQFLYNNNSDGDAVVWALGRSSLNKATVFWYNEDTDLWVSPAGNISLTTDNPFNSGIRSTFFKYKNFAYWLAGTTKIQRYETTNASASIADYQTITAFTNGARPLHNLQDDIAYFAVDNLVYSLDDTTWNGVVLTLPSDQHIYAQCEYGQYNAIAVNVTGAERQSIVYFWDRDSSLATTSQKIVVPDKEIYVMGVLNGRLMAVATDGINIYILRYNGSEMEEVNKLTGVRASNIIPTLTQDFVIQDNKFFFVANYRVKGYGDDYNYRTGVYAVDSLGRITLDMYIDGVESNSSNAYLGLFYNNANGQWWLAHATDGVKRNIINGSSGGVEYSDTQASIYESLMLENDGKEKKLVSVGVMTEPLPAGGLLVADGQIVLKYRFKEDEAWTTIFTHNENGSRFHDAINIESSGDTLPEFREIQFRAESTGGAVITGLTYKYEEIDSNVN